MAPTFTEKCRYLLVLDPRFELDFDVAFATGPARPHGMAFR
jgi:hypothetical protein